MLYGAVVFVPTTAPLARNSTFATVPSTSPAVAASAKLPPRVVRAPFAGLVNVTVGGTLLAGGAYTTVSFGRNVVLAEYSLELNCLALMLPPAVCAIRQPSLGAVPPAHVCTRGVTSNVPQPGLPDATDTTASFVVA